MVSQLEFCSHGSVGGSWLVTVQLNYLSNSGWLQSCHPAGGGFKRPAGSRHALLVLCRYCLIFNDT